MAIGIGYVVTFALLVPVGAPPSDGEAWLKYLAGKTTIWWIILALAVMTDILWVAVGLSLYFALKRASRDAMLLATALVALFVALDLSVTWTNYASLLVLSGRYSAATTEAQRAIYLAAAAHPAATLASPLQAFYAITVLSLGILITGVVMLRGVFNKWAAYLALATGALGIVAVTGWTIAVIVNAVLATIWVFLVGFRLSRLARINSVRDG